MYTELLDRAVKALKLGKTPDLDKPLHHGTEIDLGVPALLPDDYIYDVHIRLIMYKRISNAQTKEALDELRVERRLPEVTDVPTVVVVQELVGDLERRVGQPEATEDVVVQRVHVDDRPFPALPVSEGAVTVGVALACGGARERAAERGGASAGDGAPSVAGELGRGDEHGAEGPGDRPREPNGPVLPVPGCIGPTGGSRRLRGDGSGARRAVQVGSR